MQIDPDLLEKLREETLQVDRSGEWPRTQFELLAEAGILGWSIPQRYSGMEISQLELISGYEQLAAACLTTAFILTQRTGACQRIAACENETLKQELLPALARGELFATVGISHLTTSRQHIRTPAVQVIEAGDDFILNGSIPWVTGAAFAQYIVTGGALSDGRQLLLALPAISAGLSIQPHAELMGLTASYTASVDLDHVRVSRSHLLAGPVHEVMKQGMGGGTGSQTTSTLAMGLAARILDLLRHQSRLRPDLNQFVTAFAHELETLRADRNRSMEDHAGDYEALANLIPSAAAIRRRANSLVLRLAQAAMVVSKGAGYLHGHEAELAVREAMFFLVWSCPQPVLQGMLEEFSGLNESAQRPN